MPVPVQGIYCSAHSQTVAFEGVLKRDKIVVAEIVAAKESRLRELVRHLRISRDISKIDKKVWNVFVKEGERCIAAIRKNLGLSDKMTDWNEIAASFGALFSVIQHLEPVVSAPAPLHAAR